MDCERCRLGLKNATAVTILAGYVESGDLKPYVQEYFPLSDVARAFNISAEGGVVGESRIVSDVSKTMKVQRYAFGVAGKLGIVIQNKKDEPEP